MFLPVLLSGMSLKLNHESLDNFFTSKVNLLAGASILSDESAYPVKVTVMEGDLPISTDDCGKYESFLNDQRLERILLVILSPLSKSGILLAEMIDVLTLLPVPRHWIDRPCTIFSPKHFIENRMAR